MNNYLVYSLQATMKEGHIPASHLLEKILSHSGTEAYHCMFDMEERQDYVSYQGLSRSTLGYIWFDFDSDKDAGLTAYAHLKSFVSFLGVPEIELVIFFSGKKGFALGVPAKYFPFPETDERLPKMIGLLAHRLKEVYPSLDAGIYNASRKFRVPYSIHPKTGLYKTKVALSETLDAIKARAKDRQIISFKEAKYEEGHALPQLVSLTTASGAKEERAQTDNQGADPYAAFTQYKDKKCIKRLIEDRCDPGGRHKTALIILSDLFHIGIHREEAQKIIGAWAKKNGLLAEGRDDEIALQLDKVYSGAVPYTFGCATAEKAAKCTSKCSVYRYLSKEIRPQVMDEPKKDAVQAGILEAKLVKTLLETHEGKLIREGKDFFAYQGTHWEHLNPEAAPDHFKRLIDAIAGEKLKYKDIVSAYNRFFTHVATPPNHIKMFQPNYLMQNFSNGTLRLEPQSDSTFLLNFNTHRREDFLPHCHSFPYDESANYNQEFEDTLDRVWDGDPDKEAKKQAYFEVLGACLVSAFRKIVFFIGEPKTGKSTLILFATMLVDEKYRCSVDPSALKKFNLSSMAGKLLNWDTDINVIEPIGDSVLKKIEDRIPLRIERKGFADIYAPIPAMHLFGGNRMPVSQEGAAAYDRRALVLRCDKVVQGGQQDFANHVWAKGPGGIVRRAIEGLKRLSANGGKFTIPESSRQVIQEWKEGQGDTVEAYISDVRNDEIDDTNTRIIAEKEAKINRADMYRGYIDWAKKMTGHDRCLSRNRFYSRLRELKIKEYRDETGRYLLGFRTMVPRGSDV